jgi:hypothetical protein
MTNSQTSCDFTFNFWAWGSPLNGRANGHEPRMTTDLCCRLWQPATVIGRQEPEISTDRFDPENRPVISCHVSRNGSRVLNRLWPEMPVLGSSWLARRPGEVLGGGGKAGEDGLWFHRDEETLGNSFLSLALAAMAEWEELSLLGCENTAPCLLVAFNGWKRICSWAVVEGIGSCCGGNQWDLRKWPWFVCQDRVLQDLSVVDRRCALRERERENCISEEKWRLDWATRRMQERGIRYGFQGLQSDGR